MAPGELEERLPALLPKEETRAARPLVRRLCRATRAEALALLMQGGGDGDPGDDPGDATWLLSTVHQAKGMEWPTVHLPNLAEGQFPLRVQSPEEAEEESRIFFVAATRARTGLVLSCAGDRPSEFLKGLPLDQMSVVDHRAAGSGGGGPPATARFQRKKR